MEFNHYRLTSRWELAAGPGTVYAALRDVEHYPLWWPQVRRATTPAQPPGEPGGASVASGRLLIRSVLPYDLLLTVRARRQDEAAGVLEAELSGDLVGWSRWTVRPAGSGSRAVFEEDVRPGKPLMRRLALPARPLFLANHALMMRSGERGLRAQLAGSRPGSTRLGAAHPDDGRPGT
ncbi:SRPBCC family protein [Kitasatospora nipponensis]|uniref:SRPBCC family protein n=1 Tax=Kitasatospora nipponensis TaxID=258049 RepID=A0ABN1VQ27_9ACTN